MEEAGNRGLETEAAQRINRCYSAYESALMSPVQTNIEEIVRLCRRYQVRRLAAFGSVLRPDFDSLRSDADFLVEFEPVPAAIRIKNYLALRNALASLLSRNVDLIEDGAIRNPYILKSATQQQQILYAA